VTLPNPRADDEDKIMHPAAKKRRVVASDEDEEAPAPIEAKTKSKHSKANLKRNEDVIKKPAKPPKSVSSRASSVPPSEVESNPAQPPEEEEEGEVSDAVSEEGLVASKTCDLVYLHCIYVANNR